MSTTTMQETFTCCERIYAGSALEPAEYCENEVAEDDAFCEEHGGDALDEANERAYQARKDGDA